MATKSQHSPEYRPLMALLRALREEAGLTQRDLGELLGKPQSWVHNCEVGNRRVDVAEFAAWAVACKADPAEAFARFLRSGVPTPKPPRKAPRKGC
jgi:transcriptional regulator with XRE-family HTH domain